MRGLTLIEILIVIGLLAALAALTMPALVQRLDARAFDAGGDVIQRHLALSRAHARRTSDAVEVVYEVADRRMIARPFDVAMRDDDAPDAAPLATVWSIRELPGRAMLSAQAPLDAIPDGEPEPEPAGDAPSAPFLRVAVFLGDGSALIGDPLWLTDDDGRRVRITLNPLTGAAMLDSGDATPVEEDAPEEGDDPDEQAVDEEAMPDDFAEPALDEDSAADEEMSPP